ncbi:DNA polymerase Y family protein [Phyllobacterium sp. 0TCS1.6C]|uniref:Y-family DNA polymerase n=1 Tax=unclassified Phyllobacterium TaxID=2638441 RepID=UPI00226502F4|nr:MULTISPECIES: DNA polymerase Y family protein [unclassified Phyllobacterium]MCX8282223.1 DNA polymerase Y family protein [Phyllobacterium sp. 0TCS1.6C]MCX8294911.1 DNA polymerase Y family protein [Phyllobacterium sp. 0TCS1.6A]
MVEKAANVLRLMAVDEKAAAAGLYRGMALTDARAQFEKLDTAFAAPRQDNALLEKLADWCDRYTPLVAVDEPHGLILDVTGCLHLHGGEEKLLHDIHASLKRHGICVRSAIAANPAAARALARYGNGGIAGGGIAGADLKQLLYRLPLTSLEVEHAHLSGLKRAGLLTVGDVDVLPRAALTARFGARTVNRLDALFSRHSEPISPRRIVPICMAERRMAEPLTFMEAIEGVIRELAGELAQQLKARVEGAREVEAVFFRADGNIRRLRIETGRPVTDAEILMRLLKERLASLSDPLDAGYGFDIIRLAALRVEKTMARQTSLDNHAEETDKIGTLVDRLSIRLGSKRVLRPVFVDTHIPERAAILEPATLTKVAAAARWNAGDVAGDPPQRPIRMFHPPEPIEATFEIPDAAPAQFVWRKARHIIVLAEGPERIAPEWWRENSRALTRDYYRLEDDAGRRFWVFREGLYERNDPDPKWFVHGIFA